jgi:hypothetical protein
MFSALGLKFIGNVRANAPQLLKARTFSNSFTVTALVDSGYRVKWELNRIKIHSFSRSNVLKAINKNVKIFLDDTPCSLAEIYRHFGRKYRLENVLFCKSKTFTGNNIIIFPLNTILFLKVKNSYIFRLAKLAVITLSMKKIKRKHLQLQLMLWDLKIRISCYIIYIKHLKCTQFQA